MSTSYANIPALTNTYSTWFTLKAFVLQVQEAIIFIAFFHHIAFMIRMHAANYDTRLSTKQHLPGTEQAKNKI